jgi:hypothetical protein
MPSKERFQCAPMGRTLSAVLGLKFPRFDADSSRSCEMILVKVFSGRLVFKNATILRRKISSVNLCLSVFHLWPEKMRTGWHRANSSPLALSRHLARLRRCPRATTRCGHRTSRCMHRAEWNARTTGRYIPATEWNCFATDRYIPELEWN